MKSKILLFIAACIVSVFVSSLSINNPSRRSSNSDFNSLIVLSIANAESADCSVDCGDGTSISISCFYECRASTKLKMVRCFDDDMNIIDEDTCD